MTKQKMLNTLNSVMDDCKATNLDTASLIEEVAKIVKKLVQQLPDNFDA